MIVLKNGAETDDPRLDRVVHFDQRSRNFGVTEVLGTTTLKAKHWFLRDWYDQMQEGACVSFAFHHCVSAGPVPTGEHFSFEKIRDRYWEMQRRDPWPGGAYPGASPQYGGTAGLTGAAVMKELGYFGEYRWAFGIDEVLAALCNEGPVVLGVDWFDGMYEPDTSGVLRVSGRKVGGHEILARGFVPKPRIKGQSTGPCVRLHNSWGKGWGLNGECLIPVDDLDNLLKADGEACVPIQRRKVKP